MEARYTAWHYFLAEVMQHLIDERHLEVHPFEKLGSLPLEADIILLRKHAEVDLAALHPEFDFLLRHVGTFTVVEYKSPRDRLTHEDLDTVRAYAMLCKRKFEVDSDADVRIAMLYSHAERGFFKRAEHENGLRFDRIETGTRRCDLGRLTLLSINLTELGKERPGHLMNLFSSRHRTFATAGEVDPALLGAIRYVYENLFRRRDMKHSDVRNLPEFTQDMEEIRRRLLEGYSIEERLEGIPPEKLLERIPPEKLLERIPPEKRLEGLSPEEREKLKELLNEKSS